MTTLSQDDILTNMDQERDWTVSEAREWAQTTPTRTLLRVVDGKSREILRWAAAQELKVRAIEILTVLADQQTDYALWQSAHDAWVRLAAALKQLEGVR